MDAPHSHCRAIWKMALRCRGQKLVGGKLLPFKFTGLFAAVSTSTHRLIAMQESRGAYSFQV